MLKRAIILTLLFCLLAVPSMAQTSKIQQQKEVIAKLEKRIAQEEQQLELLKQNKASAEQQIESLALQIDAQNRLISETKEHIKQLNEEIEASEARLQQLGGELKQLEASVGDIVRSAYRNYRYQNYLTYLFSAKSFTDLAQRIAILRASTNFRYNQIMEVTAIRSDVQQERNLLAERRSELANTKKLLDKQHTKLQTTIKKAKKEVSKMSNKQQELMRNKTAHEKELNAAIQQLRKLIKGNKTGDTFEANMTTLTLPVSGGRIKSSKGNFAEIVGREGAGVSSVYEGKVVDIKRDKITNKYIVFIAHGEYLTSYANLSAVSVQKGAVVKRDQRIGTIGSALKNISTLEMEYKIVFSIYAPSADVKISAAGCFKK